MHSRPKLPAWCTPPRILTGIGALVLAWLLVRCRGYRVDDAYIIFRYAQQLATGHGLVFNPGEAVEGYSCPLWVLLLGGLTRLGCDPLCDSALLGVLSAVGLWLTGVWVGPLCGWSIAWSLPVAAWAGSGMETVPYAWLLLLLLVALEREAVWVAVVSGALVAVSRPEAPLLAAAVLLAAGLSRSADAPRRAVMLPLLGVMLAVLGWLVFRLSYYDAWWPNTAPAKLGGGWTPLLHGLQYLGLFGLRYSWAPVVLLLALWLGVRRRLPRRAVLAVAVIVAQLLFILMAGGDWMRPWRFLVPVWAPLGILVATFAGASFSWRTWVPAVWIAGCMVINYPATVRYLDGYRQGMDRTVIAMGRDLRFQADPGDLIALGDIGALPWYSGLRVIDLYGLVEPQLARLPGPAIHPEWSACGQQLEDEVTRILARQPRYIALESATPCGGRPFIGRKRIDQLIFDRIQSEGSYRLLDCARFSSAEFTWLLERSR